MGMGPQDIIIESKDKNSWKEDKYLSETLENLQALTSEKLTIEGGKVKIVEGEVGNENADAESTELINNLITDKTKTTKITDDTKYSGFLDEGELEKRAVTVPNNDIKAINDKGTGSTIYFSNDVKMKMTTTSGQEVSTPAKRVLAHELKHAENARTGKVNSDFRQEERNARAFENRIFTIQRQID